MSGSAMGTLVEGLTRSKEKIDDDGFSDTLIDCEAC